MCKVVERPGEEIQAHFVNFNARCDAWLDEDSHTIHDPGDIASCAQVSGGRNVALTSKAGRDEDDLESSATSYNPRKRPSLAVECAPTGGASLVLQWSGAAPCGCADDLRAGADTATGISTSLG